MKTLKFLAIIAGLLIAGNSVMAQNKTGYISIDNMVAIMPETGKLDSLLQRYQADSLNPQFVYMVQEYNRKDSTLTRDSARLAASVRNQIKQELENLAYQVQNWQPYVQQAMQQKQQELLEPIYRKVMNAVTIVAKEKGYTHVFSREAMLVMPPADDLLPAVAAKLNVKVPPQLLQPPK